MGFNFGDMLDQAKEALEGVSGEVEGSGDILKFFKGGGVYFFDESDSASEKTYYSVEDLMGEVEGESITSADIDEEGSASIYYDSNLMDEETALKKYKEGEYSITI